MWQRCACAQQAAPHATSLYYVDARVYAVATQRGLRDIGAVRPADIIRQIQEAEGTKLRLVRHCPTAITLSIVAPHSQPTYRTTCFHRRHTCRSSGSGWQHFRAR